MSEGPVRTCPGCGQTLRFPCDIGGMLMACPVCGHQFASPFRLAGSMPAPQAVSSAVPAGPSSPPVAAQPAPPALKPVRADTVAARVAALYAAKAR